MLAFLESVQTNPGAYPTGFDAMANRAEGRGYVKVKGLRLYLDELGKQLIEARLHPERITMIQCTARTRFMLKRLAAQFERAPGTGEKLHMVEALEKIVQDAYLYHFGDDHDL